MATIRLETSSLAFCQASVLFRLFGLVLVQACAQYFAAELFSRLLLYKLISNHRNAFRARVALHCFIVSILVASTILCVSKRKLPLSL
jgi:hypothetical protein